MDVRTQSFFQATKQGRRESPSHISGKMPSGFMPGQENGEGRMRHRDKNGVRGGE